jgi:SAM-dependent methyltransferase
MGFDVNGVKFLLSARASGVSFERVATIGRQGLHLDSGSLTGLLRLFGVAGEPSEMAQLRKPGYAEPLLRLLGASEVCSVDASAFEGASLVHDMNRPIPESLACTFTAVIDGGSLEHIFDFPRAVRNCMEMLAVGGHFLGITPANNFLGHGFYQFSPDLYYRIFTRENGFEVERLLYFENVPDAEWFEFADPAAVGRRIEFSNQRPTYLLVQARKLASVEVFAAAPQQSDYTARWAAGARPQGPLKATDFLRRFDPAPQTGR